VVFTNSVYNINESNYKFYYSLDGVTATFVTIPFGQYSVNELITKLEQSLSFAVVPVTVDFTIDPSNYKLVMLSCSPPIEMFVEKYDVYNRLGEQLGLRDSTGITPSYLFPNIIDISGLDTVNICSQALTNYASVENVISKRDGKTRRDRSNIVKVLPVTISYGYKVNYINQSDQPDIVYPRPKNIQTIDIQMRDSSGEVIELNGSEVFLSLEVTFI